jgi:hypothetical protein
MRSARFGRDVVVTAHARERMAERKVDDALLRELVEFGDILPMEAGHMFIYRHFAGRRDNLICAAAVEVDSLVIKTVMVNWTLRRQS